MKTVFSVCFLLSALTVLAQPTRLELGMRRNTAQTMMGKAKLDSYKQEKTIYNYPDSVFFTLEFNDAERLAGFYWSGKNQADVEKTITENGFTKTDSITFCAKYFTGLFVKQLSESETVFRFTQLVGAATAEQLKPVLPAETIPKEPPFYGFTVFGAKVWEKKIQ